VADTRLGSADNKRVLRSMRRLENFVDPLYLNEIAKGGTFIWVSVIVAT
jgi:hypothetical protein